LAVITMPQATPSGYLRGGAALQRLWLAAHEAGLAVQPVSPLCVFAVEDGDFATLVPEPYIERLKSLATRMRRLAGLGQREAIVLVLRLSHAHRPSARSLRIPLPTVLLGTTPPTGAGPPPQV
jgi:hypothetical protein